MRFPFAAFLVSAIFLPSSVDGAYLTVLDQNIWGLSANASVQNGGSSIASESGAALPTGMISRDASRSVANGSASSLAAVKADIQPSSLTLGAWAASVATSDTGWINGATASAGFTKVLVRLDPDDQPIPDKIYFHFLALQHGTLNPPGSRFVQAALIDITSPAVGGSRVDILALGSPQTVGIDAHIGDTYTISFGVFAGAQSTINPGPNRIDAIFKMSLDQTLPEPPVEMCPPGYHLVNGNCVAIPEPSSIMFALCGCLSWFIRFHFRSHKALDPRRNLR